MPKMVQLSSAAYERLRNAKRPKESFSEVVMRLTGPRKGALPLDGLKGLLTTRQGEAMLRMHEEVRKLDLRDRWSEPR